MPGSTCNRDVQGDLSDVFDPAAWHRVYDESAPPPAWQLFQRVTDEIYQTALPLVKPGELWLDLGCGTGVLSKRLVECGARLWGIDHDPAMLRWAKKHVLDGSPVVMLAAEVTRVPCDDRSVDGVVAASLTGCLDDADPLMREISRILVPGGYAILSFTNNQSILLKLSGWFRRHGAQLTVNHPCRGRFHRYRIDDMVRTARVQGLHLVLACHFNCFIDLPKRAFPPTKLARGLERLPLRFIHQRLCRNFVLLLRRHTEQTGGNETGKPRRLM